MPYCPSQLVSWFYDICNQDHPNQYSLFLISFLGNNGLMKDIISNYRSLAFEVGKSVFRPFQNPEDTWPISSTGQGCFTFIPFSAICRCRVCLQNLGSLSFLSSKASLKSPFCIRQNKEDSLPRCPSCI